MRTMSNRWSYAAPLVAIALVSAPVVTRAQSSMIGAPAHRQQHTAPHYPGVNPPVFSPTPTTTPMPMVHHTPPVINSTTIVTGGYSPYGYATGYGYGGFGAYGGYGGFGGPNYFYGGPVTSPGPIFLPADALYGVGPIRRMMGLDDGGGNVVNNNRGAPNVGGVAPQPDP